MSDLFTRDIYRPMGPAAWQKLSKRAAESLAEDGAEPEEINAKDILEALKVTISFHTVDRLEALRRVRARDEVIDWAAELTGVERAKLDLEKAEFDHAAEIIIRLQAVDILACIDWDDCHGIEFGDDPPEWFDLGEDHWVATDNPADWTKAKDWFFEACLDLAHQANPQFPLGVGQVPFG